jgi:carbon monoxide dehydrogenase subunit G
VKIEGSYVINTGIERAWELLTNPEVLARVIPGVQSFEPAGEGVYDAELQIGIGAVRGRFSGRVEVRDPHPPETYTLHVEGKGPGAFVTGEGHFRLEAIDDAGTTVHLRGEAQIGGVLARVGQRMMGGAARTLTGQFFERLNREAAKPPE